MAEKEIAIAFPTFYLGSRSNRERCRLASELRSSRRDMTDSLVDILTPLTSGGEGAEVTSICGGRRVFRGPMEEDGTNLSGQLTTQYLIGSSVLGRDKLRCPRPGPDQRLQNALSTSSQFQLLETRSRSACPDEIPVSASSQFFATVDIRDPVFAFMQNLLKDHIWI
ncbi:pentatricopeptide repeat (PPR) superfamily protein [Striga asiatica]|uniref:Pentatricopeptide repeat (PPR) superfamily protein n=1 Tax=Striga asiatica TaxID=4170 RepID=A0A5A7PVW5_STRAF|nr:pentatricopeptide repeat (PPR) superfamily protein [Striga asiatica]